MTCWQRFRAEFGQTMFGMEDPPEGVLDMDASFHIGEGFCSRMGLAKFLNLGIAVGTLIYAFCVTEVPSFYPSFLTPWGVFFCILYLLGSVVITTCISAGYDPRNINAVIKLTWLMYSIAAVIGCCIAVLYWTLVWNPKNGLTYNNVMTHGGVLLVVLFQGIYLDRVPMRLKHLLAISLVTLIMEGWLALQNTVIRYNPNDDDDDDALYDAIKWREKTTEAAIKCILVLIVLVPFFTLVVWMASLPGRRYQTASMGGPSEELKTMNKTLINDL